MARISLSPSTRLDRICVSSAVICGGTTDSMTLLDGGATVPALIRTGDPRYEYTKTSATKYMIYMLEMVNETKRSSRSIPS